MTFDDWWGAYPTQEDYEDNSRNAWNASAASRDAEIAELRQQLDALTMQCEKLVKWKHLMSYNDSYFGEHAGDLKRVVYEIDRSMPIRGDK